MNPIHADARAIIASIASTGILNSPVLRYSIIEDEIDFTRSVRPTSMVSLIPNAEIMGGRMITRAGEAEIT